MARLMFESASVLWRVTAHILRVAHDKFYVAVHSVSVLVCDQLMSHKYTIQGVEHGMLHKLSVAG